MSKQHLTTDDLERYCLGMVTASEELAKLEEHLLACSECVERAERAQDYVATVRAALRSTGSR
jgi:anti-sigma factor RsiW